MGVVRWASAGGRGHLLMGVARWALLSGRGQVELVVLGSDLTDSGVISIGVNKLRSDQC